MPLVTPVLAPSLSYDQSGLKICSSLKSGRSALRQETVRAAASSAQKPLQQEIWTKQLLGFLPLPVSPSALLRLGWKPCHPLLTCLSHKAELAAKEVAQGCTRQEPSETEIQPCVLSSTNAFPPALPRKQHPCFLVAQPHPLSPFLGASLALGL